MEWIAEQEIFGENVATVSSIQESERKTTPSIKLKNIWKQYLPVPGNFKKSSILVSQTFSNEGAVILSETNVKNAPPFNTGCDMEEKVSAKYCKMDKASSFITPSDLQTTFYITLYIFCDWLFTFSTYYQT